MGVSFLYTERVKNLLHFPPFWRKKIRVKKFVKLGGNSGEKLGEENSGKPLF
jgi:hypothetical protein